LTEPVVATTMRLRPLPETGPFSERTVVLSASEATIAGREPSKGRFGNYSDP
jgi:hypothetical protein